MNRSNATSEKLLKRLTNINKKVSRLQSQNEIPSPRIVERKANFESSAELAPLIRDKPNFFITNQVVIDIKTFIKIVYSAVNDFYEPVLEREECRTMREDIVESVTNLILSKDVYKIMFSFFRVEYTKTEENLRDRYREYKNITPAECRVNEYFRMDETSPIK